MLSRTRVSYLESTHKRSNRCIRRSEKLTVVHRKYIDLSEPPFEALETPPSAKFSASLDNSCRAHSSATTPSLCRSTPVRSDRRRFRPLDLASAIHASAWRGGRWRTGGRRRAAAPAARTFQSVLVAAAAADRRAGRLAGNADGSAPLSPPGADSINVRI